MSTEMLGLILLVALITCIFIGFPISFTLIILSFVFGTIGFGAKLVAFLMFFQTTKQFQPLPRLVLMPPRAWQVSMHRTANY